MIEAYEASLKTIRYKKDMRNIKFIVVKFINKGIDLINLPKCLRDSRIQTIFKQLNLNIKVCY